MKLGKKGSIHTKEEVRHMAVSMAVVPLLKGEAATKIVDDFKKSKFIPATTTDRENASSAIAKFLREKNRE